MSWIRERSLSWIQMLGVRVIRSGRVPKHVAFIMDGNRRYAQEHNVEKVEGHSKGFDKLAETLQWCLDLGITEVTVYAFSIENFNRTREEVDGLMELAKQKFQRLLDEKDKLMEHGVCIRVIGNLSLLPADVRKLISEAMLLTRDNNKAVLNVAFAYTGRDEITQSIRTVVSGTAQGLLSSSDISQDLLSQCMYSSKSSPPELLVRTSGEVRLSDFLLWQVSCSCLYFTDVFWPDFTVWHLLAAVFFFQRSYSSVDSMRKEENFSDQYIVPKLKSNRTDSFIDFMNEERFKELLKNAAYGVTH